MEHMNHIVVNIIKKKHEILRSMLGKKPIDINVAQNCIAEIKELMRELLDNNAYHCLSEASIYMGNVLSLSDWPKKRIKDDIFYEFIDLMSGFFSVNISDACLIFTKDENFNARILDSIARDGGRDNYLNATNLAPAMKYLLSSHQFQNLERFIDLSNLGNRNKPLVRDLITCLLDPIADNPKDKKLVDYFTEKIIPSLSGYTNLSARSSINTHGAAGLFNIFIKSGNEGLAKWVYESFNPLEFGALPYIQIAEKYEYRSIHRYTAFGNLSNYMNINRAKINTKELGNLIFLTSKNTDGKGFSDGLINFKERVPLSSLEVACNSLEEMKAGKLKNKTSAGIHGFILREYNYCKDNNALKLWHKKLKEYPSLSRICFKVSELKKGILEEDLGM